MATTTNYSWTTPNDSDPFKDGALAIRTLGSAVDTTLFNTVTGKNVGMSMLATSTFSAQTTISVSNIFTSSWDNYKILINITSASADNTLLLRLRSNTTDNATTSYNRQELTANSTTVTAGQGGSQTAFLAGKYNTAGGSSEVTLYNPLATQYTWSTAIGVSPTSTVTMANSAGFFTATTSFNGFSLVTGGGNITGTVRVYGLRSAL